MIDYQRTLLTWDKKAEKIYIMNFSDITSGGNVSSETRRWLNQQKLANSK